MRLEGEGATQGCFPFGSADLRDLTGEERRRWEASSHPRRGLLLGNPQSQEKCSILKEKGGGAVDHSTGIKDGGGGEGVVGR